MFGVTGAGLNKIKNMQSGGKRHRWSVDQWDKVGQPIRRGAARDRKELLGRLLTVRQQSATDLPILMRRRRRGVLTAGCSDGSRQAAHGVLARANRQPESAARVRIKQPLESTYPDAAEQVGRKLTHHRSRNGCHRTTTTRQPAAVEEGVTRGGSSRGNTPCIGNLGSPAVVRRLRSVQKNARFVSELCSCSGPRGACRPGRSPGSTCSRSACSCPGPAETQPWKHHPHS